MSKQAEWEFVVEKVPAADVETVERTIGLGNEARARLGLLPHAVYYDAAGKDCLLAARHRLTGRIAGYVLFRLPRDEVVLTHLCVDPSFQRAGIAALLLDEVHRRHERRQGIRAKCRDDYPGIEKVWTGLGFTPRAKAVGRGRDAASMTVWWRDHNHPNLFTLPLDEPAVVTAALDTNVLIDLHLQVGAPRADRSQVLLAPDLQGRVELVVPYGLEHDLHGEPESHRDRLLDAAEQNYRRPRSRPGRAQALFEVMAAAIAEKLPRYPATQQDEGDLWQLAEAAASGVKVFLTWDERLRTEIAPHLLGVEGNPAISQLRVLDPNRLFIHLDELAHAMAYQPIALEGSAFRTVKASAMDEAVLMSFLDSKRGEKKAELRALLGELARNQHDHLFVKTPDDETIAAYAVVPDGEVLRVPLLRLADHAVSSTLGRQLLWQFRKEALACGASVVRIDDPYLSLLVDRTAGFESYRKIGPAWFAFVVDAMGPGAHVTAAATRAYKLAGLPAAPLIPPGADASAAMHYERAWWPAKITDSELPHFAVAIKPKWSAELLGRPEIFSRRADVALGREQIYYRSGQNSALKRPGRILWYMSHSPTTGPGCFIGTSLLDDIETGEPEALFAMYGHYGVFHLTDVHGVAKTTGKAQVLQLSDMELFRADVKRSAYLRLRDELGGPKVVQSPVKLSPELFAEIYALGSRRRGDGNG